MQGMETLRIRTRLATQLAKIFIVLWLCFTVANAQHQIRTENKEGM